MQRILIYGFGPYQQYTSNITEVLLRSMKLPRNVFKEVFEVRFSRRMFENTFETVRPDVILGLGQHPRARKLRIERRTYKRDHPAPGGCSRGAYLPRGFLAAVGAKASCNRVDFEGKGGVRAGGSWRATDACGEAGAKVDAQHASSRSG